MSALENGDLMQEIVNPLLIWYRDNKRILPWRIDKNPYHVWISEIMLQQTRIEAVKEYYVRFMNEIPTILDLANIEEDRLLKLWEGLGYYNRARNLKKAAIKIKEEYHGRFPNTYEDIVSLPGIGEYTAGAIGSICFSLKEVAVDGNVLRVYMRVNNCYDNIDNISTRKNVARELKNILPDNSGDFNEGIMELGETVCLPNGMPKCEICPISKWCQSYKADTMLDLPIRSEKKKPKEEKYTIYLFVYRNLIAIQKRESGLLQKLWQFPNEEGNLTLNQVKAKLREKNIVSNKIQKNIESKHIFSHRIWKMQSYLIQVDEKIDKYNWVTIEEIKKKYAVATAFQLFIIELEKTITDKKCNEKRGVINGK